MKVNEADPVTDGLAQMAAQLLPRSHRFAIVVFDEKGSFSVTHNCGMEKLHEVSDSLRHVRKAAAA